MTSKHDGSTLNEMQNKERLFACGSNPTGSVGLPSQEKVGRFQEVLLKAERIQHVNVVWSTLTRTFGEYQSLLMISCLIGSGDALL